MRFFASCFLLTHISEFWSSCPPTSCVKRAALSDDQASNRRATRDFGSVISRIFPRSLETGLYWEEVRSRFRAFNLRSSTELSHGWKRVRWVGIDFSKVTIWAMSAEHLRLRSVSTRFSNSDHLPHKIGHKSVPRLRVVVSRTRAPGHVVRLDWHEAYWTIPKTGLFYYEPQRKFGSWLRICDPGDRSQFISTPVRFTDGRAILCWVRRCKVSGNVRSAFIDGG